MTEKSFTCPECNGAEFKKDYNSEHNIETYCTRCGLILKKDDLVDEYDGTNWSEHGFRPNSWDICYANHVTDYFKELSLDYGKYNEETDNLPEGYSRIPKKGEGNLSEGEVFQEGRIPYEKYLKYNNFEDNDESKLKYLRRYNQYEFNKCLEIIGNQNIVKQSDKKDVHQPKYNFGSEKTPEIPTKIVKNMNIIKEVDNRIEGARKAKEKLVRDIQSGTPSTSVPSANTGGESEKFCTKSYSWECGKCNKKVTKNVVLSNYGKEFFVNCPNCRHIHKFGVEEVI